MQDVLRVHIHGLEGEGCRNGPMYRLILLGFHLFSLASGPAGTTGHYLLRRSRRRVKGLCFTCGYDLRGMPEPRCPECGMAFDGHAEA